MAHQPSNFPTLTIVTSNSSGLNSMQVSWLLALSFLKFRQHQLTLVLTQNMMEFISTQWLQRLQALDGLPSRLLSRCIMIQDWTSQETLETMFTIHSTMAPTKQCKLSTLIAMKSIKLIQMLLPSTTLTTRNFLHTQLGRQIMKRTWRRRIRGCLTTYSTSLRLLTSSLLDHAHLLSHLQIWQRTVGSTWMLTWLMQQTSFRGHQIWRELWRQFSIKPSTPQLNKELSETASSKLQRISLVLQLAHLTTLVMSLADSVKARRQCQFLMLQRLQTRWIQPLDGSKQVSPLNMACTFLFCLLKLRMQVSQLLDRRLRSKHMLLILNHLATLLFLHILAQAHLSLLVLSRLMCLWEPQSY